jgi:alkylation response protein AidB-like acyl-CoA dehydrogenase
MAIEIEIGYNLGQRLNWMVTQNMDVALVSCQLRVLGAEVLQHLANLGMQIFGHYGQLDEKSKWARLKGKIKHMYLASPGWSIGGGTSEVSKNFIAIAGLGLPQG